MKNQFRQLLYIIGFSFWVPIGPTVFLFIRYYPINKGQLNSPYVAFLGAIVAAVVIPATIWWIARKLIKKRLVENHEVSPVQLKDKNSQQPKIRSPLRFHTQIFFWCAILGGVCWEVGSKSIPQASVAIAPIVLGLGAMGALAVVWRDRTEMKMGNMNPIVVSALYLIFLLWMGFLLTFVGLFLSSFFFR